MVVLYLKWHVLENRIFCGTFCGIFLQNSWKCFQTVLCGYLCMSWRICWHVVLLVWHNKTKNGIPQNLLKCCSNNFNLSESNKNGLSVILCEFKDHRHGALLKKTCSGKRELSTDFRALEWFQTVWLTQSHLCMTSIIYGNGIQQIWHNLANTEVWRNSIEPAQNMFRWFQPLRNCVILQEIGGHQKGLQIKKDSGKHIIFSGSFW